MLSFGEESFPAFIRRSIIEIEQNIDEFKYRDVALIHKIDDYFKSRLADVTDNCIGANKLSDIINAIERQTQLTALNLLVYGSYTLAIEHLIKNYQASVNLRPKTGALSAIEYAARLGNWRILEILLPFLPMHSLTLSEQQLPIQLALIAFENQSKSPRQIMTFLEALKNLLDKNFVFIDTYTITKFRRVLHALSCQEEAFPALKNNLLTKLEQLLPTAEEEEWAQVTKNLRQFR